MAKQKWVRPEGCPLWFDGKNVNEAMFCQEFLTKHRLLYTENAFFTVNGRMVDETPLKSAISFCLRERSTHIWLISMSRRSSDWK